MALDDRKISGYLQKKKHQKTWGTPGYVERWYVLRGDQLFYYDDESSKSHKGVLELSEVQEVNLADLDPKKHDFILQCESRDHKLRAASKEGMRRWVQVIQDTIDELKQNAEKEKDSGGNSESGQPQKKPAMKVIAAPATQTALPSLDALNKHCMTSTPLPAAAAPEDSPSGAPNGDHKDMLASLEARIQQQADQDSRFDDRVSQPSAARQPVRPRRVVEDLPITSALAPHNQQPNWQDGFPSASDEEEGNDWSDLENRDSEGLDQGTGVGQMQNTDTIQRGSGALCSERHQRPAIEVQALSSAGVQGAPPPAPGPSTVNKHSKQGLTPPATHISTAQDNDEDDEEWDDSGSPSPQVKQAAPSRPAPPAPPQPQQPTQQPAQPSQPTRGPPPPPPAGRGPPPARGRAPPPPARGRAPPPPARGRAPPAPARGRAPPPPVKQPAQPKVAAPVEQVAKNVEDDWDDSDNEKQNEVTKTNVLAQPNTSSALSQKPGSVPAQPAVDENWDSSDGEDSPAKPRPSASIASKAPAAPAAVVTAPVATIEIEENWDSD